MPARYCFPRPPRTRSGEGFSLLEMLVVLGVITILVTLTYPLIATALARGKSTECQNNLKQWGMALGMYLDENRGQFPTDGSGGGVNVADPKRADAWFNVLPKYVNQPTMAEMERFGTIAVPGTGKSMFVCPAAPVLPDLLAAYAQKTPKGASQKTYYNSYAYNWWIDNQKGNRTDFSDILRLSQVRNASIFAVFADSATGFWKGGEFGGATPSYRYSKTHPRPMAEAERGNAFRHAGRANIGFADGHVASFRMRDIWFRGMTTRHNFGGIQWNPMNDDLRGGEPAP